MAGRADSMGSDTKTCLARDNTAWERQQYEEENRLADFLSGFHDLMLLVYRVEIYPFARTCRYFLLLLNFMLETSNRSFSSLSSVAK